PGSWPCPSRFRAALRDRAVPPVCMWITLQSTNVIELAAAHGLDTVILDQEHTPSGLDAIREQMVAAQLGGMIALVRPPSIDPHQVGRILDLGADGIVFPRVSSVEDARTAAAALRYPPRGTRGWAGNHARHVRWNSALTGPGGEGVWSAEFVAAADESIASVFMIEGPSGVEQLEDILDAGTPDAIIFGWGDYLLEVEFDRARVAAAKKQIYDTCRRRGVGIALSVPSSADDQPYYPGCFFSAGVDSTIVSDAIRARMDQARAEIARLTGSPSPSG
ncbi:MAG TPA: aldolase/citrate lyase family protein, partial [Sporichthya sp.]|nr:aldolase/citrate lyase family protein [Sporichthya sp.]